jgi:hypothetical protein
MRPSVQTQRADPLCKSTGARQEDAWNLEAAEMSNLVG